MHVEASPAMLFFRFPCPHLFGLRRRLAPARPPTVTRTDDGTAVRHRVTMASKIDPTIIRATDVAIQGDVAVGACCVLSPQCRILAEHGGRIVIGSHNLIEDQVVIRCSAGQTLTIGSHNMICVGTHIQDAQIGSYNTINPKCQIGKGVKVQDDSLIATMTVLDATTNVRCRNLPTRTCVFRNNDGLRLSMHPNTQTRPDFELLLRRTLDVVSKLMLEVTRKKAAAAAAASKQQKAASQK